MAKLSAAAQRADLRQRLDSVLAEIAEAGVAHLREIWQRDLGEPPPPKLRSPEVMRRMLAWRLQARALGGLSSGTVRRLQGIEERRLGLQTRKGTAPPPVRLRPGTRLVRDWHGVRHEVQVTPEGFVHDGRTFASLSEIASLITGTRWNGPKFFGLREASRKAAA